jgi:hypothetical protein
VTLDINVMHVLLELVAVAVALVVVAVVVAAKADWYPATARPPAATVPPVTVRAWRRLIVLRWWFPVMVGKVGTRAVRRVSGRCAQGKSSQRVSLTRTGGWPTWFPVGPARSSAVGAAEDAAAAVAPAVGVGVGGFGGFCRLIEDAVAWRGGLLVVSAVVDGATG